MGSSIFFILMTLLRHKCQQALRTLSVCWTAACQGAQCVWPSGAVWGRLGPISAAVCAAGDWEEN